ncbi:zinc ribbon domain-containing protein [Blattabacterium cuenoti]|uniref:zinc ribbon domain-containing protein n=1 Tax=Blattabacterium cuenoti TaxID=1653831 RepID=UPI00163C1995|nr:hypothetical protein [Blattabacterium cuenoti]
MKIDINKKNITVTEKLRVLYNIQLIDSRIDEIRSFYLHVPMEIKILEKEIEKTKEHLSKIHSCILSIKEKRNKQDKNIHQSELLIHKYKKQKYSITSNRELYTINKEIDYQNLEIQLSKKKIKEFDAKIRNKNLLFEEGEKTLENKKQHFIHRKKELEKTTEKNKKEEKILLERYLSLSNKLEKKIFDIYKKIRKGVKNGIAIAPVQRGAPLGSYLAITPQKYSELIQRKKILIDEHSGRILIDEELAEEERKKSFLYKKEFTDYDKKQDKKN